MLPHRNFGPIFTTEDFSARLPAALPGARRWDIWIGIVATIVAGAVYLYLTC